MILNDILVLILKSAVEGLRFSDTRTMPVRKVMAVDPLQSVAKHNFISPIMFGSNVVMHSIAGSGMAVDIDEKLHLEGQYNIMKSWVNGSLLCQKETF